MLSLVIAAAAITHRLSMDIPLLPQTQETATSDVFRKAINKAMAAAQLTQSAEFREEWHAVATLWQEAIDMMQAIPAENQSYALAQDKASEYRRNLTYARNNTVVQPAMADTMGVWSAGSVRELVTAIEGRPSRTIQLDTQCKEILYYGNSQIELIHGAVAQYRNIDNNLHASSLETVVAQQLTQGSQWTLGSPKETIYAIEGTPGRVNSYESLDMELLYYGDDVVELRGDRVVAYSNFDDTLSVTIAPVVKPVDQASTQLWTLGSLREEVFYAQQTPTRIQRRDSFCEEVLYYGSSTVELKNGVVVGYNNISGNLQVR